MNCLHRIRTYNKGVINVAAMQKRASLVRRVSTLKKDKCAANRRIVSLRISLGCEHSTVAALAQVSLSFILTPVALLKCGNSGLMLFAAIHVNQNVLMIATFLCKRCLQPVLAQTVLIH